jgi:rhodanese-related sulfurtransferase
MFAVALAYALAQGRAPDVGGAQARKLVSEQHAVLVDVRTAAEFAEGHLPGAINVPLGDLSAQAAKALPEKTREVVVYCRSGHRSAQARDALEKAGYTHVHDLGAQANW